MTAHLESATRRYLVQEIERLKMQTALAKVRSNSSGTEHFTTNEEANAFADAVYKRFDPNGYGTICIVTDTEVRWSVYSAD